MGLDGFDAAAEPEGDLPRAHPLADELKDLQLTVGQAHHGPGRAFSRPVEKGLQESGRGPFAHKVIPAENRADGGQEAFGRLLFHHVATRPGPERALGENGLVVHGEDQHAQVRHQGLEVLDQFQAMTAGQGEVQHDDVRLQAGHGPKGIPRGLGFATHREIALAVDPLGQTFAHDRVIVHDQHFSLPRPRRVLLTSFHGVFQGDASRPRARNSTLENRAGAWRGFPASQPSVRCDTS